MLKILYSHYFQYSTRIIKALIILILQIGKWSHEEVNSLPCGKFTTESRKWTRRTVERQLLSLTEFISK